jgi:Holliday junction resolvase RusA-like endonuclease
VIIEFFIPGTVTAKGRVKSRIVGEGKSAFIASNVPAKTRKWEAIVRYYAQQAMQGKEKFEGPVRAEIVFAMPRPQCREFDYFCATKPDIDNLVKSILDSVNLILWKDDCIVTEVVAKKLYESSFIEAGAHVKLMDASVKSFWLEHVEEMKEEKKRLTAEKRRKKRVA